MARYLLRTASAQLAPTLGAADSLSILAATTITDATPASTTISGDVASTGGGAAILVPCSSVGGSIFSVDAAPVDACVVNNSGVPAAAQAANTAAFGDLIAGPNSACTTIPVELGSQTLGPGVYCSGGVFTLSGTLTLTGEGIWIFQSTASLITSGTGNVVGGDPCDVWWRLPQRRGCRGSRYEHPADGEYSRIRFDHPGDRGNLERPGLFADRGSDVGREYDHDAGRMCRSGRKHADLNATVRPGLRGLFDEYAGTDCDSGCHAHRKPSGEPGHHARGAVPGSASASRAAANRRRRTSPREAEPTAEVAPARGDLLGGSIAPRGRAIPGLIAPRR